MPIDVAEMKRAAEPIEQRIASMLAQDPSKAYSLTEIVAFADGLDPRDVWSSLSLSLAAQVDRQRIGNLVQRCTEALQNLEARGVVQTADVRGTTYYAARQP